MGFRFWRRPLEFFRKLTLEALEERIVLNATVEADSSQSTETDSQAAPDPTAAGGTSDGSTEGVGAESTDDSGSLFDQDLKVILISNALDEIEAISNAAKDGAQVIVYDAEHDDLEAVVQILDGVVSQAGEKIGTLGLVDHGDEGVFNVGTDELHFFNVAEHAASLRTLGDYLSEEAQILVYACDVAGNVQGQALIESIAYYTGASVFASDDATGGSSGDWILEYGSNGEASTSSVFELTALEAVDSALEEPVKLTEAYSFLYRSELVNIGRVVYFMAGDDVQDMDLWRTDGTVEGTYMVKDMPARRIGSNFVGEMFAMNDTLYFSATNGSYAGTYNLWRSDGTEDGTYIIADQCPAHYDYCIVGGDTVYFPVWVGGAYCDLWKSDGTSDGTVRVAGPLQNPGEFYDFNGTLYFTAWGEPWRSNGTEVGTYMIKDIYPGEPASGAGYYVSANNVLLFRANDGVHGPELWKTDGTADGTLMVKDILPGPYDGALLSSSSTDTVCGVAMGDVIYFKGQLAVGQPDELWRSDGTAEGTYRVEPVADGGPTAIDQMTLVGDRLFFAAGDLTYGYGNNRELWVTDGTPEGTYMVKDIYPGYRSGLPVGDNPWITDNDGIAFFAAVDGVHGTELWQSDGTEEGTFLAWDVNQGGGNSFPQNLLKVNPLFFVADDGGGLGLWLYGTFADPPGTAGRFSGVKELDSLHVWGSDPSPLFTTGRVDIGHYSPEPHVFSHDSGKKGEPELKSWGAWARLMDFLGSGESKLSTVTSEGSYTSDESFPCGLFGYQEDVRKGGVVTFNMDEITLAGIIDSEESLPQEPPTEVADLDPADLEDPLWQMVRECQGKCLGTRDLIEILSQSIPPGIP